MGKASRNKSTKQRVFVVDMDDYCDATMDVTLPVLQELRNKYPNFKVTLFTIPMRTSIGTIAAAKSLGDWVALAPHGWWHTRGECFAWSAEEAQDKISMAAKMGIDAPTFRAPGWLLDGDVYTACRALNYVVASHATFRIPATGVPEYIYNNPVGRPRHSRAIHGHCTPVAGNFIRDMAKDGRLGFGPPKKAHFSFVHESGLIFPDKPRLVKV